MLFAWHNVKNDLGGKGRSIGQTQGFSVLAARRRGPADRESRQNAAMHADQSHEMWRRLSFFTGQDFAMHALAGLGPWRASGRHGGAASGDAVGGGVVPWAVVDSSHAVHTDVRQSTERRLARDEFVRQDKRNVKRRERLGWVCVHRGRAPVSTAID